MTLQDLIACAVVNGTEREVFEPLLSRGLERDLDALRNRQLISVYASHVDPYFRAMAASHTATPWSILRELMNDRDQAVRGLA